MAANALVRHNAAQPDTHEQSLGAWQRWLLDRSLVPLMQALWQPEQRRPGYGEHDDEFPQGGQQTFTNQFVARQGLLVGNLAFENGDYARAREDLQEVWNIVKTLPYEQQAEYDVFQLDYKLAMCAAHVQDLADVETALERVTKRSSASRSEDLQLSHAQHLLAQIYVLSSRLEPARSLCDAAYEARSKHLEDVDLLIQESRTLTAVISCLDGNPARTRPMRNAIGESIRSDLIQDYGVLMDRNGTGSRDTELALIPVRGHRESDTPLVATQLLPTSTITRYRQGALPTPPLNVDVAARRRLLEKLSLATPRSPQARTPPAHSRRHRSGQLSATKWNGTNSGVADYGCHVQREGHSHCIDPIRR